MDGGLDTFGLGASPERGTIPQVSQHPELLTLNGAAQEREITRLVGLVRDALSVRDPYEQAGTIRAANNIDITGSIDNRGGIVDAGNVLSINNAKSILNDAIILADGRIIKGKMEAGHILIANGGNVSNKGGKMVAGGILSIEADSLHNERIQQADGTWTGGKLKGDQVFAILKGDLTNKGGIIENNSSIYLEANNIRNESTFDDYGNMLSQAIINGNNVTLIANEALINYAGKIKAKGTLYAEAGHIINDSRVVTDMVTTQTSLNDAHSFIAQRQGGTIAEQTTTADSRVTGLGVMKGEGDTILISTKGDIYNRGNITAGGALIAEAKGNIINEVITGQKGTAIQRTVGDYYRGSKQEAAGHIGTVSLGGGLMQGNSLSLEAEGDVINKGGWINARSGLASIKGTNVRNEAIVDTWNETTENPYITPQDRMFDEHNRKLYGNNVPAYLQKDHRTSMPTGKLVAMGHITGDQVLVDATGEVYNQGTIAGENGTIVKGKNVINDTIRLRGYNTDRLLTQENPHRPQDTHTLGGIFNTAQEGSGIIGKGGNTTILADETIFNYGKMQAGETLTLAANQVISNAQTGDEARYLADGREREFNEVYGNTGLLTGKNVQVSGTQGVTLDGGTVLATENAQIVSEQGNVTIAGKKRTWEDSSNNRPFEYVGGEVLAGGNTRIHAGGQVALIAADVGAYDDVTISGDKGILASSMGQSITTVTKRSSYHEHALLVPTTITSGTGNINLVSSGGDITLVGTQLDAGALLTDPASNLGQGKINAYAKGDIVMDAMALEERHFRNKQSYVGLAVAVVVTVVSCVYAGCAAAGAMSAATAGSVAAGVAAGSVAGGGTLAQNVDTDWNGHNVALTTMSAANGINIYAEGEVKGKGVLFGTRNGDISAYGVEGTTFDSEKVTKYVKQHGWRMTGNVSVLGGMVSTDTINQVIDGDYDGAAQSVIRNNETLNVLNNLKHVDGDVGLLNLANAGMYGYNMYNTGGGGGGAFDVNARLGTVNNSQEWTESYLSQFNANNGNVFIGSDKDVNLLGGTQISAGRDIVLNAGRDLNIAANEDTFKYRDTSTGVTAGYNGGWYVGADHSKSKTDSTTYTNANLNAGGDIITTSGRDTNIAGANLLAKGYLDMDVGRNLTVATLQNSTQSENYGGSFTVGYGQGSASVHKGNADRLFSDNQTTLIGQEGVRVKVGGHTQIDGAAIANIKEDGTDGGNLVLDTGTLGFRDLADNDDSHQVGLSASYSESGEKAGGSNVSGTSGSVSIVRQDVDSVTRATVGEGLLIIRDGSEQEQNPLLLNRDISKAQEVMKSFNSQGEMTIKVPKQVIDAISSGDEKQVAQTTDNISEEDRAELLAASSLNVLLKEGDDIGGYELSDSDKALRKAWFVYAKKAGYDVENMTEDQKVDVLASLAKNLQTSGGVLTVEGRMVRNAIYASLSLDGNYLEQRNRLNSQVFDALIQSPEVQEIVANDRWKNMDTASKITLLQGVADFQQSIYGNPTFIEIIPYDKNTVSDRLPESMRIASGLYYHDINTMFINTDIPDFNNFGLVLNTVMHEGTHAYQDYIALDNPYGDRTSGVRNQSMVFRYNYQNGMSANWNIKSDGYLGYRSNPLEHDAFLSGDWFTSQVKNAKQTIQDAKNAQ